MNARMGTTLAAAGLAVLLSASSGAASTGLGVEVWTDRGNDQVYEPGDRMEVRARVSEDAYLLVYEIDADGNVLLLFPYRGSSDFVAGRSTFEIPSQHSNVELVVQEPTGQGYIVAIASRDPFVELPWYLRPYDEQAEEIGYQAGDEQSEEGITREGRIVGDPFVAMERIRRRVLQDPEDSDGFASVYTSFYVHHQVRYPRYLCYDCHRPHEWAWWDGFDPYYTSCTVFDFRVNRGWCWGPSYWAGYVPYYYYVFRYDCPPRYRYWYTSHACYSSWDGWRRWNGMWGSRLTRYKSDPPSGYVPPSRYKDGGWKSDKPAPPGYLAAGAGRGSRGVRPLPIGRSQPPEARERSGRIVKSEGLGSRGVGRMPMREAWHDRGEGSGVKDRGARPGFEAPRDQGRRWIRPREAQPMPRFEPPREEGRRWIRPREAQPRPRPEPLRDEGRRWIRPREAQPMPRSEPPREEGRRWIRPREERPMPRSEPPRDRGRVDRPAPRIDAHEESARPSAPAREERRHDDSRRDGPPGRGRQGR